MKNISKKELYARQTRLQEFGEEGQQKLQLAKVLVAGCGGLGNTTAIYLAASGIGEIHLVDFDVVSASNLHRQVFYTLQDIAKPKAEVLAKHIESITPFVRVKVIQSAITKQTVFKLIDDVDYVIDCTDSLPTKYLLNDACVLQDKPLIYGSLYKFDGYVSSFNIQSKTGYSCNLRDAFPEQTKKEVPNCAEVGTLNTIVGIIGLMQANEVIKLVTDVGRPLINELLIYNSQENSQFKMKIKKKLRKNEIKEIFESTSYYDPSCAVQDPSLLINPEALKQRLASNTKQSGVSIISVIEDTETLLPFDIDAKIPLSNLDLDQLDFDAQKEYIIVCKRGISSYTATQKIKAKFPELKVLSLQGGISSF